MAAGRVSISMKDVAALAGVSIGTVSNVLNSPGIVAEDTQQRVHAAIDKLGWVRNETARQLRAGNSNSVGMVVMDASNPYFTDIMRGAEDFFYEKNMSVYLANSDQEPQRETRLLKHFQRNQVSGVILTPIEQNVDEALMLVNRRIPVVLVDRSSNPDFCGVGVDDVAGGELAVKHLLEQGHHRMAFAGGPLKLFQVRDRLAGANRAVDSVSGASLEVLETKTLDVAEGCQVADQIMCIPDGERPTAVFAANDLVAIGMLQGFVAAGISVPDDIAIIGYDDIEFAAAAAVPLSSIRQPRRQMGERVAKLLYEEIRDLENGCKHFHEAVRFAPELVARQSTLGNN